MPRDDASVPAARRLRIRRLGGVVVEEFDFSPGDLRGHLELPHRLSFLASGAYQEPVDRKLCTLEALGLVYRPPECDHRARILRRGTRVVNVRLEPAFVRRVGEYAALPDAPVLLPAVPCAALGVRLYRELGHEDTAAPLAIEGLVLELVAELVRQGSPGPRPVPWLRRVRDILHAQFVEPPALGWIAREVGVHRGHLARAFRREFGCTVGAYVRRLRIDSACRALATTDEPMSRVALRAGFADQAHFSRAFRAIVGMTPREFRGASRPRSAPR